MNLPVGPEDVKIVQGASGKGLQVLCVCGAVNWNHLEMRTAKWACPNCGRILSNYFPGLAAKVLAQQKVEAEAQPQVQSTTT
jgi:dissimilatory sulfite reductase (desulfoviridin) alpha/beta subunit